MILARLCDYAHRLEKEGALSSARGYEPKAVRWLINLDEQGNFLGFVPTSGGEGRRDRGKTYSVPVVPSRTSQASRPALLVDTADYVLGREVKGNPERARQRHRDFTELVRKCSQEVSEEQAQADLQAVLNFLSSGRATEVPLPEDWVAGDVFAFSVAGRLVHDHDEVRKFWASRLSAEEQEKAPLKATCIACGRHRPVMERHDLRVKGVPGGRPSGTALISANAQAFESYGLKHSLIAPVCSECAVKYVRALNHLLRDENTHLRVGNALAYVFWTREPTDLSPFRLLSEPDPQEVRRLITAVFRGRPAESAEPNRFYALALSGSGGRTVIRNWLETTVPEVKRNLARYFQDLTIAEHQGGEPKPHGLFALAASLVPDAGKLPPPIPVALLRIALEGLPLPPNLLALALRRCRAEGDITEPRAALIKLALSRNPVVFRGKEVVMTEELDLENRHPAYLCGRLLSVLEAVQQAAVPGIKATLVDRFFGSACSAPASVFGRLLTAAQAHLGNLRKNRPGLYRIFEESLESVLEHLPEFPHTLSLQEQGLFVLGYYHQRAADRKTRRLRAEQREADSSAEPTETEEETETGDANLFEADA